MPISRAVILWLLACACSTAVPTAMPGQLRGMPWSSDTLDQQALRARQLSERGRTRDALDLLEQVLEADPDHVDAHRLRQDLLRARGRRGLLLSESEARLRENPDDPIALYLRGRIVSSQDDKLALFRRSSEMAPDLFWGWLGLAFSLRERDPERAVAMYRQLWESSDKHPLAGIALASVLRQQGEVREALEVYGELRGNETVPGVGDLGIAETFFDTERKNEAWPAMLTALKLRPYDPGVHALVGALLQQGLSDQRLLHLFDVMRQDPALLGAFARSNGDALLVNMYTRLLQPHAAIELLADAGLQGPRGPAARRVWRRLLLATGDVAGFLGMLGADYPEPLLDDETNQVRGLWVNVLRGPWTDGDDPVGEPARALALTRALRDAGLLDEAEMIASLALLRWGDSDERAGLTAVRDEVRRELAFEGAMRRVLYHGYAAAADNDLDGILTELRRISTEVLGEDVVGTPDRFHVPLVGELVDPFSSGLGEHLARYNHHLVLGQRSGGPVEGMVLTRLSVRELPEVPELPLSARCLEVVGENREIRSYSSMYGGDLAGVAILNHYLVDMDAVREWAGNVADRRRVAREDGMALLDDPLPAALGPVDPMDVYWRLAVLSSVEDRDLELAVLDVIRWHEHAHLVDSYYFLPAEENLMRVLGLLFGNGFSALSVEAEMEKRAELAALALSPHTRLVLAHIADFLQTDEELSPHGRGFRSLAKDLVAGLRADGVPAEACHPSRWHELDPEVVRGVARRLLDGLW